MKIERVDQQISLKFGHNNFDFNSYQSKSINKNNTSN